MQRVIATGESRDRLARARAASVAIRSGMSPGGRSRGSSMSTTVRSGAASRAPRAAAAQVASTPLAHALRQHPQPHHVAQEADRAVDAGLVGEVGRRARLGEHRRVELQADQRPGAARRCRRSRRSSARHADHRRRGVVRPDRDDRHRRRSPADGRLRQHRPDRAPGSRSGGSRSAGMPSRAASAVAHCRGRTSYSPVVEALVRSATDLAGQPVAEQVGHQQQRSAAASCGVPGPPPAGRCVLKGSCWRPLTRVQLGSAELARRVAPATPSVRRSR